MLDEIRVHVILCALTLYIQTGRQTDIRIEIGTADNKQTNKQTNTDKHKARIKTVIKYKRKLSEANYNIQILICIKHVTAMARQLRARMVSVI